MSSAVTGTTVTSLRPIWRNCATSCAGINTSYSHSHFVLLYSSKLGQRAWLTEWNTVPKTVIKVLSVRCWQDEWVKLFSSGFLWGSGQSRSKSRLNLDFWTFEKKKKPRYVLDNAALLFNGKLLIKSKTTWSKCCVFYVFPVVPATSWTCGAL